MSRTKGNLAEEKAKKFLEENSFEILEQNFYSRFGEIDIIATKDDVLHFIEVKSALDYELAIQNITPKKLSKIIKTSEFYLKKINYTKEFQFDAVIVTPKKIWHLQNITI